MRATSGTGDPWRLEGSRLAPEILLVAKLLAASLLLQGYVAALPEPFLPLLPGLETSRPGLARGGLQVGAVAAAVLLIGNRAPRAGAVALGAILLLSLLATRGAYRNSIVYTALVLLLVGLSEGDEARLWLRAQLALVYGGSALNKALDPDWRSGRYVDHWLGEIVESPLWEPVAGFFPPRVLGQAAGVGTIVLEAVLAVGFAVPALTAAAVAVAVGFHAVTVAVAGTTFGIFVAALLFTYPAFFPWPGPSGATARYDPGRRRHRLLARYARRGDRDGRVAAKPVPGADLRLDLENWTLGGTAAAAAWVLLTPATWFAFAVAAAVPAWWHWTVT